MKKNQDEKMKKTTTRMTQKKIQKESKRDFKEETSQKRKTPPDKTAKKN